MVVHDITIRTDVVESDIPLLLSKPAMKKVRVKLDLENGTAEILGTTVILNDTSSGHYCIPIDRSEVTPVENVCRAVDLEDMSSKEIHKTLLNLRANLPIHPKSNW